MSTCSIYLLTTAVLNRFRIINLLLDELTLILVLFYYQTNAHSNLVLYQYSSLNKCCFQFAHGFSVTVYYFCTQSSIDDSLCSASTVTVNHRGFCAVDICVRHVPRDKMLLTILLRLLKYSFTYWCNEGMSREYLT